MKQRCVKHFSRSSGGLIGHAIAVEVSTTDEVVLVMPTREAVARVAPRLGFYDIDMRRAKHVVIAEVASGPVATGAHAAAQTAIQSIANAFQNAIDTAEHPSSKPHREARRAFFKRRAELNDAIELLAKEREREWTPVGERLPDDGQLVLIALNDDDTWTGFRDGDIWRYCDGMPVANERVTDWKPIPPPPSRAP